MPIFVYNGFEIDSNECLDNKPIIECNYIAICKTYIISNDELSTIHVNY